MGAAESTPSIAANAGAPRRGYHVARVAEGSPAHLAGIEPFFDYLVGLEGQALDPSINLQPSTPGSNATANGKNGALNVTPEQQQRIEAAGLDVWRSLEKREGTMVTLNVWNSKRQEFREVPVVPSRQWSTSASSTSKSDSNGSTSQPSLLGLSLRLCDPSQALSAVWHVLDILEGSPAALAGLVPYGDYVIGWAGAGGRDHHRPAPGSASTASGSAGGATSNDDAVPPLRGEGDFYELVERYTNRPLRLYVYNSDFDHTREVIIIPNRDWGGEGLLGCGVGYGLLHRIPRPQDRLAPSSLAQATLAGTGSATSADPVNGGAAGAAVPPPPPRSSAGGGGPGNAVRDSVAMGATDTLVEEDEEEEDQDEEEEPATATVSVRQEEE